MAATAEAVMLRRCPNVALDGRPVIVDERDATGDPIRTVARNLDARRAHDIHLLACFTIVHAVAERAGRTGPHGVNDFVQACAARSHERLLSLVKYCWQVIAAEPRMGAGAAIVQHSQLLTAVGVFPIGDSRWILAIVEAILRMGTVAKRLD